MRDKKCEPMLMRRATASVLLFLTQKGFLGLSPVIWAKIHSKCASHPENVNKITKTPESSSAVLVMISSMSVSICNRFHDRRVVSVCLLS